MCEIKFEVSSIRTGPLNRYGYLGLQEYFSIQDYLLQCTICGVYCGIYNTLKIYSLTLLWCLCKVSQFNHIMMRLQFCFFTATAYDHHLCTLAAHDSAWSVVISSNPNDKLSLKFVVAQMHGLYGRINKFSWLEVPFIAGLQAPILQELSWSKNLRIT